MASGEKSRTRGGAPRQGATGSCGGHPGCRDSGGAPLGARHGSDCRFAGLGFLRARAAGMRYRPEERRFFTGSGNLGAPRCPPFSGRSLEPRGTWHRRRWTVGLVLAGVACPDGGGLGHAERTGHHLAFPCGSDARVPRTDPPATRQGGGRCRALLASVRLPVRQRAQAQQPPQLGIRGRGQRWGESVLRCRRSRASAPRLGPDR